MSGWGAKDTSCREVVAPGVSLSRRWRLVDIATVGVGLLARFGASTLKGASLPIVAAIAPWQLDLTRPVAQAELTTAFATFGIAFALAVGLGSAKAVPAAWERRMGRREDE